MDFHLPPLDSATSSWGHFILLILRAIISPGKIKSHLRHPGRHLSLSDVTLPPPPPPPHTRKDFESFVGHALLQGQETTLLFKCSSELVLYPDIPEAFLELRDPSGHQRHCLGSNGSRRRRIHGKINISNTESLLRPFQS